MKEINYKWLALSCTTIGALMSVLDGSIMIVALPVIMKDLHADMTVIMWTLMGYMLALTILVPSIGRVADMYGRKKLYVSGFAVFTISSFLCSLSASGWELLVFRMIQAVGGSLMIANSTAIVTDAFPKKELGKALGINAMVISIGSVIGPILGGYLTVIGWRSIFYVNIPIGIVGTIWAWLQIKEVNVLPEEQKFDWKGTIVFTFGMLLLLLALTFGSFTGFLNGYIMIMFVVAIVLLVWFIIIEKNSDQPMLDIRLFKIRILAFAYGSNLLNGIARGAVTFLLIFYFQGLKGFDPLQAGIMLTPFALSMLVVAPVSGMLSDKFGARILSSVGLLISAFGLIGFMRIGLNTPFWEIVIWMLIMGAGSGMFFSPNSSCIMGAVPVEKRGIAAGTRTMMNNTGTVLSIALAMAVISTSISPDALMRLFVGTQVGSQGINVTHFISGLRAAFTFSFIFSLLASFISYLRGNQNISWENPNIKKEKSLLENKEFE